MILNNSFEEPYNKFAPDGPIPIISKSIAKSKLTKKFTEMADVDLKSNNDKINNFINPKKNSK